MKQVALVVLLGVLVGCSGESSVALADGRSTKLSHWEGRWLIVNYWAEWCAPCRVEIPELNALHRERAATGLVVLGVNYDGLVGDKLEEVIERMGIDFPVLVDDPRERWGYDLPAVLPATMLIDPEGNLHRQLQGPQTVATLIAAMQ